MEFRKQEHRLRPTWHLCAYAQEKGIFERGVHTVYIVYIHQCARVSTSNIFIDQSSFTNGVILGLVFYLQLAASGQAHRRRARATCGGKQRDPVISRIEELIRDVRWRLGCRDFLGTRGWQ